MLIWELDLESPSRRMVAATAFAGCALWLASVALRSKSKPALPLPTEVAEKTVLWIAELHGGTEDTLELLADFQDEKCVEACAKTVACALSQPPPPNLRPPLSILHVQTHAATALWMLRTSISATHSAVGHASRESVASGDARQVLSDDVHSEERGVLEDGKTLLDETMFLDSGVDRNEVRYMF